MNSVISVRKLPIPRSIIENQPQNGPNRSKISSACPRCVAAPNRTVISWTTSAIPNVSTTKGRKNPIPNFAPVAAYESMLGPSFSPSITRMPGPISSQSNHVRARKPCPSRAVETRARSCARSMSSCVTTTSSSAAITRNFRPGCASVLIPLFFTIYYLSDGRQFEESRASECAPEHCRQTPSVLRLDAVCKP